MQCQEQECEGRTIKWGKTRDGHQHYRCKDCGTTFSDTPPRPLAPMRLPEDRAVLCLSLLVKGMSIRSVERVTGHHRDTVCRLLALVGGRCEKLLSELVQDVEVEDVQADEIWAYVGMKQSTMKRQGLDDPELGDAWTFVAMERESKLALAFEVGKRTIQTTDAFVEKLDRATAGRFQVTTDGFNAYPHSINYHLGMRTDYAQLIKHYGSEGKEEERRYSPPRIIAVEKKPAHGDPAEDRVCTSHVERQNLTMRMQMRRFTRLTNAFSKKWSNLRAAVALHFAHYNLCRLHSTIKCTGTGWSMSDLVKALG